MRVIVIREHSSQGQFLSSGVGINYKLAKEGKKNVLFLEYWASRNHPGLDGRKEWHKTKKVYVPKNLLIIRRDHMDLCGNQSTSYIIKTYRNGLLKKEEKVDVGDYVFNYPTPWLDCDLTREQIEESELVSSLEKSANERAEELEKLIKEGEEIII